MIDMNISPQTPEQIAEARAAAKEATHYGSWRWDEASASYVPPSPPPNDGLPYLWDENYRKWVNFPGYPINR